MFAATVAVVAVDATVATAITARHHAAPCR
jgi:hypothetical protein